MRGDLSSCAKPILSILLARACRRDLTYALAMHLRLASCTFALWLAATAFQLPAASPSRAAARQDPVLRLEAAAGQLDRSESIASVSLPAGARQAAWIRSDDGKTIALQVDSDGRGWFIVDALKAGAIRGYTVDLLRKPSRKRDVCDALFEGSDV